MASNTLDSGALPLLAFLVLVGTLLPVVLLEACPALAAPARVTAAELGRALPLSVADLGVFSVTAEAGRGRFGSAGSRAASTWEAESVPATALPEGGLADATAERTLGVVPTLGAGVRAGVSPVCTTTSTPTLGAYSARPREPCANSSTCDVDQCPANTTTNTHAHVHARCALGVSACMSWNDEEEDGLQTRRNSSYKFSHGFPPTEQELGHSKSYTGF